jgi:hypothetical protein
MYLSHKAGRRAWSSWVLVIVAERFFIIEILSFTEYLVLLKGALVLQRLHASVFIYVPIVPIQQLGAIQTFQVNL